MPAKLPFAGVFNNKRRPRLDDAVSCENHLVAVVPRPVTAVVTTFYAAAVPKGATRVTGSPLWTWCYQDLVAFQRKYWLIEVA